MTCMIEGKYESRRQCVGDLSGLLQSVEICFNQWISLIMEVNTKAQSDFTFLVLDSLCFLSVNVYWWRPRYWKRWDFSATNLEELDVSIFCSLLISLSTDWLKKYGEGTETKDQVNNGMWSWFFNIFGKFSKLPKLVSGG